MDVLESCVKSSLLSNESLSSQTIGVNAIAQSLVPKAQFNLQLSSKEKSDRAKVLLTCEHQDDNFFKSVSYRIEALCIASFEEEKDSIRTVGAQILSKKPELSKFKTVYK
ncbi:hypothetical protein Tco_0705334 [Tanacetum coccineum]|uniref:Uncharacterized protein n=1 Tax=Tanacetum coccineum TaxID=301880 RepID=A0ABQ4Y4B8_9ASTR